MAVRRLLRSLEPKHIQSIMQLSSVRICAAHQLFQMML
jgi:hypothetical protein